MDSCDVVFATSFTRLGLALAMAITKGSTGPLFLAKDTDYSAHTVTHRRAAIVVSNGVLSRLPSGLILTHLDLL